MTSRKLFTIGESFDQEAKNICTHSFFFSVRRQFRFEPWHSRLLASVRTKLRREFKYPSGGGKAKKWNIPAVFMRENTNISARALGGEAGDDGVEQSVNSGGRGSNCSAGAAGFVTGSMGLFAVSHIVNEIVTLGSGKVGKLPPTILLGRDRGKSYIAHQPARDIC